MPPLADLDAFKARHPDVEADQESVVTTLLGDATALILSEVEGSQEEWVTSGGTDPPAIVVAITVEVAYRAWSNPDALSRAEVGDVANYYHGNGPDAVWLTARELRTLNKAAKRSSFRAVTLETPYSGPNYVSVLDEIEGE